MTVKPVQVTMDAERLRRIDRDLEVKKLGRSARMRQICRALIIACGCD